MTTERKRYTLYDMKMSADIDTDNGSIALDIGSLKSVDYTIEVKYLDGRQYTDREVVEWVPTDINNSGNLVLDHIEATNLRYIVPSSSSSAVPEFNITGKSKIDGSVRRVRLRGCVVNSLSSTMNLSDITNRKWSFKFKHFTEE